MRSWFLPFALAVVLSSCAAPQPEPTPPAPQPPIREIPAPVVAAPSSRQPAGHWTDWEMESGSWIYRRDERGSIALYGEQNRDALVTLRCDRGRSQLYLSRAGQASGQMTVRTSSQSKALVALPTGGQSNYVASELAINDSILDAMAYSRGRIALELAGMRNIAIPVWSEIGRVVEDCRKG